MRFLRIKDLIDIHNDPRLVASERNIVVKKKRQPKDRTDENNAVLAFIKSNNMVSIRGISRHFGYSYQYAAAIIRRLKDMNKVDAKRGIGVRVIE